MPKPQEKRVLVVDDEEDVNFYLCTALEDAGFQVDSARSVDEALKLIRERPPDFVSLDMVMPGKSGILLYHEMRRNKAWAEIPLLFVTGHAKDEGVRRDLDAAAALAESTMSGPATYLEKPVTAAKYVQAVMEILGVEGREEQTAGQVPAESLREELQELIKDADPEALKEALRLLKR
jgi:CheY-like chemotaxis protein